MSTQLQGELSKEQVEAAVEALKLLAVPTRLRIVWALLHSEHSVTELADHVGAHTTTVSQHLAKLRLAHLVHMRRDGNRIFYGAANEHIERLATEALFQADHIMGQGDQASYHQRTTKAAG